MHQGLLALFYYSTWRHLPSNRLLPRLYLYISFALFLITLVLETNVIMYRTVRYGRSWAFIICDHDVVKIIIDLSEPLRLQAEQYINL